MNITEMPQMQTPQIKHETKHGTQAMTPQKIFTDWKPLCRSALAAMRALILTAAAALSLSLPVMAQEIGADGRVTLNFEETDIRSLISTVSKATGTNFVVDPRVKGKITVLSSRPMGGDALYTTFLAILQVHGYAAIPANGVVKIVPEVSAKQDGGSPITSRAKPRDDVITRVVPVENVPAAQLVPILRPLVPQYGHLAAYPPANVLIISDRSANVDRLMTIIRKIDVGGEEEIELVSLSHANASEVVRVLTGLLQAGGAQARGATDGSVQLVADERTNSILLSGDQAQRLKAKGLIAHLDTPIDQDGSTQVIYLHYAKAETLAPILAGLSGAPAAGAAGAPAAAREVNIQPDPDTNALVITAPPGELRELRSVIKQLDIRRAQVLVEAVIAEVSSADSAELGVQWAAINDAGGGISNFSDSGGGIANLIGTIVAAGSGGTAGTTALSSLGSSISGGLTYGAGDFSGNRGIGLLVRALEGSGNTNILSTPTIVTMDNEEAEISIGQEVPFLTGSFSNTGANNGSVNPFQTIEREDVGLTLNITPQINEGNSVGLRIRQEISNVLSGTAGTASLTTSKRTISTTVTVEDGQMIVLGGLIDDNLQENEQRVPVLGSLPLIGNLFKSRNVSRTKNNLMVFIRPTILRDGVASTSYTNSKYNFIRNRQLEQPRQISLLNTERPVLQRFEALDGKPLDSADSVIAPPLQPRYETRYAPTEQYYQTPARPAPAPQYQPPAPQLRLEPQPSYQRNNQSSYQQQNQPAYVPAPAPEAAQAPASRLQYQPKPMPANSYVAPSYNTQAPAPRVSTAVPIQVIGSSNYQAGNASQAVPIQVIRAEPKLSTQLRAAIPTQTTAPASSARVNRSIASQDSGSSVRYLPAPQRSQLDLRPSAQPELQPMPGNNWVESEQAPEKKKRFRTNRSSSSVGGFSGSR